MPSVPFAVTSSSSHRFTPPPPVISCFYKNHSFRNCQQMPSTKLSSAFSCIQIMTPRSSPTPSSGPFPAYISTSEFDPVLYREELIRKAYLSKFPIDSSDRPDYLITIGKGRKTCSTISVEVKGQEDKSGRSRMPAAFAGITCTITLLFLLMTCVYLSGFVSFLK